MNTTDAWAKVRVTLAFTWQGRKRECTATAGPLSATAPTRTEALGQLGDLIGQALRRPPENPQYAWDPANRMLWIAVPDQIRGGHRQHALRWTGDGFTVALGVDVTAEVPAGDAFTRSHGLILLGRPPLPAAGYEALSGLTHRHWDEGGNYLEHVHLTGDGRHGHDPVTGKVIPEGRPGESREVRDAYDRLTTGEGSSG